MTQTQAQLIAAVEAARLTALQTVRDRIAANDAALGYVPLGQLQGGDLTTR